MKTSQDRLTELRDTLQSLAGHDNAVIRTAVRAALTELDQADTDGDLDTHLRQINRLLDAALNPTNTPE